MPEISPPPPIGTTKVSISGAVPEHLQRQGALAGDHQRVVVGVDEGEAPLTPMREREGSGLLDRLAREDHLGAVPAGVDHLHRRRVDGHHDGGGDAEKMRVIGDTLCVVAGRHGNHAALALARLQCGQAVESATLLERGRELLVLELEPDLAAQNLRQRAAPIAVGIDDGAGQPRARRLDVVEADDGCCGGRLRGDRSGR